MVVIVELQVRRTSERFAAISEMAGGQVEGRHGNLVFLLVPGEGIEAEWISAAKIEGQKSPYPLVIPIPSLSQKNCIAACYF